MVTDFNNYEEKDVMEFAYKTLYKLKELFPNMTDGQVAYLSKTVLFATSNVLKDASHDKQILFYNKAIGHLDAIK